MQTCHSQPIEMLGYSARFLRAALSLLFPTSRLAPECIERVIQDLESQMTDPTSNILALVNMPVLRSDVLGYNLVRAIAALATIATRHNHGCLIAQTEASKGIWTMVCWWPLDEQQKQEIRELLQETLHRMEGDNQEAREWLNHAVDIVTARAPTPP